MSATECFWDGIECITHHRSWMSGDIQCLFYANTGDEPPPPRRKYYFISYEWTNYHHHGAWVRSEALTTKHPVTWFREAPYPKDQEEYHITFWSEIPKDVYDKHVGHIG